MSEVSSAIEFSGRVLFVSDRYFPNNIGGAERIAQIEATEWTRLGSAAVFTTFGGLAAQSWGAPNEHGVREFRAIDQDIRTAGFGPLGSSVSTYLGTLYNPTVHRILRKAVNEFRPDVIHAHHVSRMSYGAIARLEIPKVLTFHDYHFECVRGGLYRREKGICESTCLGCRPYRSVSGPIFSGFDRIIAISSFIQERLRALDPGLRVELLPNALPLTLPDELVPATAHLSGPLRIVVIGRLEPNKAILDFAEAFVGWCREEWTLTVIGDGSEYAAVAGLSRSHSNLRVRGRLGAEETTRAIADAHVVVVPSRWHEVQNTVVREAQLAGRVVIATDVGGTRDLIVDGTTGYLVRLVDGEPDWARLEQVLACLDRDRTELARLAAAGRRVALENSVDRHMSRLRAIYAELVATTRSSR